MVANHCKRCIDGAQDFTISLFKYQGAFHQKESEDMISESHVLFPDTSECFISVKVSQDVLPLYWMYCVLQKKASLTGLESHEDE